MDFIVIESTKTEEESPKTPLLAFNRNFSSKVALSGALLINRVFAVQENFSAKAKSFGQPLYR